MLIQSKRQQSGQAMPLVIACVLILTMGAFAAMQFGVLSGGSLQVRNAVDAGALSIAARATDITVPPVASYSDVANTNGQIGLTNIDRMLGKLLLITANADSMKQSGQTGQSQGSAAQALADANNVSNRLINALTDEDFLAQAFTQVGTGNSGNNNNSNHTNGSNGKHSNAVFGASYVHTGQTSNIIADSSQFPQGTIAAKSGPLPGYTPFNVDGRSLYLVPFKQGEKPHLISTEEFNNGKTPPANWDFPIPNAFQAHGQLGPDVGVQAVASAVTNPQQTYQLSIPHAWVQISIPQTQASWKINGNQVNTTTYGYTPATQFGIQNRKVGCNSVLNGYASLGNEYAGGNLLSAIYGVPGQAAHQKALQYLAQRISEISAGYSVQQLSQLLQTQALIPGQTDYVIYPVYKTADNTDPQIVIAAKSNVSAGWFNPGATPDGTAKSIGSESLQDAPNSSWGQVIGKWQLTSHRVVVNGQVNWTPGTGYNQCLGIVEIDRNAQVTFNGKCPP